MSPGTRACVPARALCGAATLACALVAAAAPASASPGFTARPEVRAYLDALAREHGFARERLLALFERVAPREEVVRAISAPAEARPWHRYRPIFVNEARIAGGVRFWRAHRALLARAEARYGVDARVIVAIIGVETRYGRHTGRHPVLASLATLAFDYPPRARFFRRELTEYLLLSREEGLDPLRVKGSYAGAMGQPQFIPSSYRRYAVDFDGDGRRDLWSSAADAIGSVAHYLAVHGWRRGAPVAVRARARGEAWREAAGGLEPRLAVSALRARGLEPVRPVAGDPPAAVLELEGADGPERWLVFANFGVIMRYNRSPKYALAVHELGEAVAARLASPAENEDEEDADL